MEITDIIPNPSYVYYEIENFFMNHRDFVKSRLFPQLRGEVHVNSDNNSKCDGAIYMKEIFNNDESKYFSVGKKRLKPDDFANPCGLIAKSFFNDTYSLFNNTTNSNVFINESGIANSYDKDYMFKRHPNYQDIQWVDVENGKKIIFF